MGISTNTNFPSGFANGLTIRNMPLLSSYPGKVFWVSSTAGSNNNRGTFDRPVATVMQAIALSAQGVAGRGDIIMIKPGHAETITAAGTIAIAATQPGIAIIGLGTGQSRPNFTFTTANTASINIAAANISFQNCIFTANFLSIATCFLLTTAKDFTVSNCTFTDTSAILDFLNIVKSTGAANTVDGLFVADNVWNNPGTASMGSLVLTANDIDRLTIARNQVIQASTVDQASLLVCSAGVITNALIDSNITYRNQATTANSSLINIVGGGTTCTGVVQNNFAQTLTAAADKLFVTTVGFGARGNSVSGVKGAQGFPIPALDT